MNETGPCGACGEVRPLVGFGFVLCSFRIAGFCQRCTLRPRTYDEALRDAAWRRLQADRDGLPRPTGLVGPPRPGGEFTGRWSS